MDKIGKLVVILSLLGVCMLYGISSVIEPPYVPLDEVGAHESAFVRTRGVIFDFYVTGAGDVLMRIMGNQTELLIFVSSAANSDNLLNLSYGDEIDVEGRVTVYQGEYELVVNENAIKKVAHESNVSFISQIALRPEQYKGRRIRVAGYVKDVYKRVFHLCDEKGNYCMIVNANENPITQLQDDTKIVAEGLFYYEPQNMRYELNLIALS
jgi:DNA/RNA endonuclease YhcR with UshA esterase domain